jgi:hypothetical protein
MTSQLPTTPTPPTSTSTAPPHERSADGAHDDDVGSDAAERFVRRHPWVVDVARVGWAAKGVVYLLTGVLAFVVAAAPFGGSGSSDEEADPSGAIAKIAEQPFGTLLLWLMALGLVLYALWRFVTVILPADTDGHALLRRVGYAVSGLTYVALAFTAVSLARRSGSSNDGASQDSRVSQATADVLAWTGGRLLVGLAGLVLIGVAVYFLWKGVSASFEQDLEHRAVGPFSWDVVRAMGRAGWIGRAAMMALIGVFVTRAAIQFDPDEARGLDDSLRRVADSSIGMILVYVVAIGLVLYGAFCVISTPSRKLVATDDDTVSS